MTKVNTEQDDAELLEDQLLSLETDSLQIPTYHWSEILHPRFKDLTHDLFFKSVTITQKIHKSNQTPKNSKPHSALVVYDSEFVKYKLLESIAPIVSDYLDNTHLDEDKASALDNILNQAIAQDLITLLGQTLVNAIDVHTKTVQDCADIGITLNNDSSTILRTIKSDAARKYKLSKVVNS